MSQKKIFVFPVPGIGHINPILKTLNVLIKKYNFKVVVYSIETFRNPIESIGAELRKLNEKNYNDVLTELNLNNNQADLVYQLFYLNFKSADEDSLKIAKIIDLEKPDLILYDSFSYFVKFSLRLIQEYYNRRDELKNNTNTNIFVPSTPPPKSIVYWTTFTNDAVIYPNDFEKSISLNLTFYEKILLIWKFYKMTRISSAISKKYQVPYYSPMEDLYLRDNNCVNIVFTFTELQPRGHLFTRKTHFVGGCVDDSVHVNGSDQHEDNSVNEILKEFQVLKNEERYRESKKLVYVSLGTAFNDNIRIISIIIDSFNKFEDLSLKCDDSKYSNVKLNNMKILFSLGSNVYKHFDDLKKNNSLTIPDNLILVRSVPQLEILKRASLFITHCGMNSTSESIHYAVPMICIPLNGDQPLNAYRIATELGLGIKCDIKTIKADDICLSIHKIFSDSSYFDRCIIYSNLSRKYNGSENGAKVIIDTINQ